MPSCALDPLHDAIDTSSNLDTWLVCFLGHTPQKYLTLLAVGAGRPVPAALAVGHVRGGAEPTQCQRGSSGALFRRKCAAHGEGVHSHARDAAAAHWRPRPLLKGKPPIAAGGGGGCRLTVQSGETCTAVSYGRGVTGRGGPGGRVDLYFRPLLLLKRLQMLSFLLCSSVAVTLLGVTPESSCVSVQGQVQGSHDVRPSQGAVPALPVVLPPGGLRLPGKVAGTGCHARVATNFCSDTTSLAMHCKHSACVKEVQCVASFSQ